MNIKSITDFFDIIAPSCRSAEWDNDGVMLCCDNDIKTVVLTLDVNTDAVNFAIEKNADLIISHHPFIFRPINRIDNDTISKNIKKLIKNEISVLSYHTRMDASDFGINQYILEQLGLSDITPFGISEGDMLGRIGCLTSEISTEELCNKLKVLFKCDSFEYSCRCDNIKKIAVVSGSGNEYAESARKHGADIFISGEFKHHHFIDFQESNFPVICIDHFHCENIFVELTYKILKKNFPELEIIKNEGKPPFLTVR